MRIASKMQQIFKIDDKTRFFVKNKDFLFSESRYIPLKTNTFQKGPVFSVFRYNPQTYPKMNFTLQKLTKLSLLISVTLFSGKKCNVLGGMSAL